MYDPWDDAAPQRGSAELRRQAIHDDDDGNPSDVSFNRRKLRQRTIAEPSTFVYVIAACSSLGGILMGYGIGASSGGGGALCGARGGG